MYYWNIKINLSRQTESQITPQQSWKERWKQSNRCFEGTELYQKGMASDSKRCKRDGKPAYSCHFLPILMIFISCHASAKHFVICGFNEVHWSRGPWPRSVPSWSFERKIREMGDVVVFVGVSKHMSETCKLKKSHKKTYVSSWTGHRLQFCSGLLHAYPSRIFLPHAEK